MRESLEHMGSSFASDLFVVCYHSSSNVSNYGNFVNLCLTDVSLFRKIETIKLREKVINNEYTDTRNGMSQM